MKSVEEIRELVIAAIPAAAEPGAVESIANPSPSGQHSLKIKPELAVQIARFLRDSAELRFDFLSNVSGVDWPEKELIEKVKVTKKVEKEVDGVKTTVDETVEETRKQILPGCLEVVYHLYSVEKRTGPLTLRMKTVNRTDQVELPSLTHVWRAAELQEREVFDLYGVRFTGHPDLRRLLMWDEFKDHPMRRDYVEPDDFEYEPTAHDQVLKRAEEHRAKIAAAEKAAQS